MLKVKASAATEVSNPVTAVSTKASVFMIFREFLVWAQSAPALNRAEGASALARAWLETELSEDDRQEADIALTSLLDDPAASVRRALAVELASWPAAPAHVVAALACDQSEVSIPVLTRSPVLSEAQLCDAALVGDVYARAAIALRPGLPESVAWMIANRGEREAVISLAVNVTAAASEPVLRRMLERFGDDGEVRESILARGDLPDGIRCDLVDATSRALADFVAATGWLSKERMERTCRETSDAAAVEIAAGSLSASPAGLPFELVRHKRQTGQLTPAFILRALLSGNRGILGAALCELTGQGEARVSGFVSAWSGAGFGALYTKAGLPAALLPVFRAALAAQDQYGLVYAEGQRPQLSRLLIDGTIRSVESLAGPELGRVMALLHRLRGEAARAEVRAISDERAVAAIAADVAPLSPPLHIDLAAIEAEIAEAA